MNITQAQANLNKAVMEWYCRDKTYVVLRDIPLLHACQDFENAAKSLDADIALSEDSDFAYSLTLFYAEEQERVALRIANTLGERYGWDHDEKDIVTMEVLGMLTLTTERQGVK